MYVCMYLIYDHVNMYVWISLYTVSLHVCNCIAIKELAIATETPKDTTSKTEPLHKSPLHIINLNAFQSNDDDCYPVGGSR